MKHTRIYVLYCMTPKELYKYCQFQQRSRIGLGYRDCSLSMAGGDTKEKRVG
jgi:hypothetical protein